MIKNLTYWLVALSLSFAVISCDDNDDNDFDNYYTALGFIDTTGNSVYGFTIDLDQANDPTLIPVGLYNTYLTPKHGDRVVVVFALEDDDDIEESSTEAIIINLNKVTLKDAVAYNDSIADELGDDLVYINNGSVWQNDSILNVIVGYNSNGYGYHTVNLATPDSLVTDSEGNYILNLYHNNNGFYGSIYYEGIISFNLNSLPNLIPNADNGITFVIQYNNNTTYETIINDTYEYPYTGNNETFSTQYEHTMLVE